MFKNKLNILKFNHEIALFSRIIQLVIMLARIKTKKKIKQHFICVCAGAGLMGDY